MLLVSPYSVFEHIFEVDSIINTINTKGYMGKGLALECALRFPEMEKKYKEACKSGVIKPGDIWEYEVEAEYWKDVGKEIRDKKNILILNAATKDDYKFPSKIEWIEMIVEKIRSILVEKDINSIAIPKLGAGLGKLNWEKVEEIIIEKLYDLDKKIIISLDLFAGERENLGIRLAKRELFSKRTLFGDNTENGIEKDILRFREFLKLKNIGKKRYSELVKKYF